MNNKEYRARRDELLDNLYDSVEEYGLLDQRVASISESLTSFEENHLGNRKPSRVGKFTRKIGKSALGLSALIGLAITGATKEIHSLDDLIPYNSQESTVVDNESNDSIDDYISFMECNTQTGYDDEIHSIQYLIERPDEIWFDTYESYTFRRVTINDEVIETSISKGIDKFSNKVINLFESGVDWEPHTDFIEISYVFADEDWAVSEEAANFLEGSNIVNDQIDRQELFIRLDTNYDGRVSEAVMSYNMSLTIDSEKRFFMDSPITKRCDGTTIHKDSDYTGDVTRFGVCGMAFGLLATTVGVFALAQIPQNWNMHTDPEINNWVMRYELGKELELTHNQKWDKEYYDSLTHTLETVDEDIT